MLCITNKSARLFTIRENVNGGIVKCDLLPGDNNIDKENVVSMLKGSFYFKELVKNKVMEIGGKEETKTDKKKKKKG